MFDRIMRAIRLEPALYREVADDPRYNSEAFVIAIVVAFLAAVGGAIRSPNPLLVGAAQFVNSLILGWLLWALISYAIGSLLGGRSGVAEMARTLAYANSPRFLALLGFIPCFGWIFLLAAWVLGIAAGVIAIRESMEFDTMKALITAVLGLIVYIGASIVISAILGGMGLPSFT